MEEEEEEEGAAAAAALTERSGPLPRRANAGRDPPLGTRGRIAQASSECERLCYNCNYDLYSQLDPVKVALIGGAAYRVNPNVDGEYYVTLDAVQKSRVRARPTQS